MSYRPLVSVYDHETTEAVANVALPAVFTAPIRSDVVHQVHTLMAKNARQAYAVSNEAGHQVRLRTFIDIFPNNKFLF